MISFCTWRTSLWLWKSEADGLYSQPEGTGGTQLQNLQVPWVLCLSSRQWRDPQRLKRLIAPGGSYRVARNEANRQKGESRESLPAFRCVLWEHHEVGCMTMNNCSTWWIPAFYSLACLLSFSTCVSLFIFTDILLLARRCRGLICLPAGKELTPSSWWDQGIWRT